MTDRDDEQDWYADGTATFGDRMAAAREATGLTQEDLARRLGVKLKTLRAWEDDLAEPRANKLQMLAGFLNVSIVWLLTGAGEGVPPPEEETGAVPAPDLAAVMLEIRQMRLRLLADAEHLARLEKALRKAAA